jgi:hypothetical protein
MRGKEDIKCKAMMKTFHCWIHDSYLIQHTPRWESADLPVNAAKAPTGYDSQARDIRELKSIQQEILTSIMSLCCICACHRRHAPPQLQLTRSRHQTTVT